MFLTFLQIYATDTKYAILMITQLQINDQRFEDAEEMESNNRNGGQQ